MVDILTGAVQRQLTHEYRENKGDDGTGVNEWPTLATEWTIRKPGPDEGHADEDSCRCQWEVVNLCYCKGDAGNRGLFFRIEALKPIPHRRLWCAVVPNDVQHGKSIGVPAEQDLLDFRASPWGFAVAADGFHALNGNRVLVFGDPPRPLAVGEVGKEGISEYRKWDCDDAIDYKEPSPARMAIYAVKICVCRCLEETAEELSNKAG